MRFVLASASPARLSVVRAAGIEPVIRVSGVDEDRVLADADADSPGEQVSALAAAKATAVVRAASSEFDAAVVVGCDSMLYTSDAEIAGKPGTTEAAKLRWHRNAGSTGTLFTGHTVIRLAGGEQVASAHGHRATVVRFGSPSEAELDTYLATGEPLHVAGGFTLEGFGGWFIEGVDGDPSSVLGISLPLTRHLLTEVGTDVTTFWSVG